MGEQMEFPKTFDEFAEQYKIVDSKEIYTNGTALIPIFRVKQWLEDRPKADVVKVIHCKNCRYYYKGISVRCTHSNGLKTPDDSTWCSYGERKQTND